MGVGTLLRVLGISTSSMIAVIVVMVPKLILSESFLKTLDTFGLKTFVKQHLNYASSTSNAASSSGNYREGHSSSDSREYSKPSIVEFLGDSKISPEIAVISEL